MALPARQTSCPASSIHSVLHSWFVNNSLCLGGVVPADHLALSAMTRDEVTNQLDVAKMAGWQNPPRDEIYVIYTQLHQVIWCCYLYFNDNIVIYRVMCSPGVRGYPLGTQKAIWQGLPIRLTSEPWWNHVITVMDHKLSLFHLFIPMNISEFLIASVCWYGQGRSVSIIAQFGRHRILDWPSYHYQYLTCGILAPNRGLPAHKIFPNTVPTKKYPGIDESLPDQSFFTMMTHTFFHRTYFPTVGNLSISKLATMFCEAASG
jgi:hypothetical protein